MGAHAMTPRTRSVAFYLPQFHPIPENDRWWGAGFTEWHNTAKAQPLFAGHQQPHVPAELGYYDLRSAETREAQAELARSHGIDAFCYYHYWFAGRRLLERPFDEVLRSGTPTLPFCLCWANESWTRTWDGSNRSVLLPQRHSPDDDLAHIRHLAPALADPRYLRIGGRPLFLVYRASELPDPRRTTDVWRDEAGRLGIGDLHLARVESLSNERGDPVELGFDSAVEFQPDWRRLRASRTQRAIRHFAHSLGTTHFDPPYTTLDYAQLVGAASSAPPPEYARFPCVTPGFDNTPRRARGAVVLTNSSPQRYGDWVTRTVHTREPELLFVNAWNEWGEGAHLEPCERWGRGYLEAHRDAVARTSLTPS
jgi:lipopolysaccharide biosynthesis protein